ncbi:hypothetical protein GPZ77_34380 (plasmid) [Streptomyces sp. QHH-9511]|uniref:hypothetical protein n=1 Tax=Streptomyces sp. QHH-9511 TaxID=2684468 RepID=UPI001315AFA2|nr:hypothetical protein [Streptomyces sp. QHH-9511]QGZ53320.1 hypothetical protein GPZ77_34380 [Streptomyces sp. QHH-9511]
MSNLDWRTADVTLTEGLVPDPNAGHVMMKEIRSAHVAVEGSFLHIDPQAGKEAYPGQGERQVTIVSASAVKTVSYRVPAPAPAAPQIF